MTSRAAEEGDVVKSSGSSSRSSSSSGRGRLGTGTGTKCLQLILWLWVAVLTVGLAIDLSLRYIPGAFPTHGHPALPPMDTHGHPPSIPSPTEKPQKSSGYFLDLVPSVKDDHRPELVPLMIKGKDVQDYHNITEDGLYLLGGEVTLSSASPDNITITIRKRSEGEVKWEPILVGHIASGSFSTGFMGRILLLEGGCNISMHSTHNARLKKVNNNLSSFVIYWLGKNPAP